MKEKFYFIVKNVDNNRHLGTFSAKSDKEMNQKLRLILQDEYPDENPIVPILEIEDYIYGDGHSMDVEDSETGQIYTIFIQQSWLY